MVSSARWTISPSWCAIPPARSPSPGVMGGLESEVTANTRNVLLEGASWNFINIRRTVAAQKLSSEAAIASPRGVHPALAEQGVKLGLGRMAEWSGGEISSGLVDAYPDAPPP